MRSLTHALAVRIRGFAEGVRAAAGKAAQAEALNTRMSGEMRAVETSLQVRAALARTHASPPSFFASLETHCNIAHHFKLGSHVKHLN
jgi:hypothetical protein